MIHEYDNMLKGSSWKGGLIDEQMGNFRSEMEATSKSQTEMLEITGKNSKRDKEYLCPASQQIGHRRGENSKDLRIGQ